MHRIGRRPATTAHSPTSAPQRHHHHAPAPPTSLSSSTCVRASCACRPIVDVVGSFCTFSQFDAVGCFGAPKCGLVHRIVPTSGCSAYIRIRSSGRVRHASACAASKLLGMRVHQRITNIVACIMYSGRCWLAACLAGLLLMLIPKRSQCIRRVCMWMLMR